MEGLFGWIGKLFEWVGRWVPRLEIIEANEGGVKFVRGRHVREVEPGLTVYWPLTTTILKTCVVRQILNLTTQTVTTRDGRAVVVSGIVVYRIHDVVLYLVDLHNADAAIANVALAAITRVVVGTDYDVLLENRDTLDDALTRAAIKDTEGFGVEIERVRLTDFAPCRALSVNGVNVSQTVSAATA